MEHARPAGRGDPGDRPQGFRVATLEKPGPTHIELPENLAAMTVDDDAAPLTPGKTYSPEPTDEAIAHAADLIAASQRPLVLAGNGARRGGGAARVRAWTPRPGRGHVHGQGRD